jgi:hypothetical protein
MREYLSRNDYLKKYLKLKEKSGFEDSSFDIINGEYHKYQTNLDNIAEKVNKVIYETNATYLPVIYGGKKVTYLSENESKNFDFSTLQNATEIQGDEYTNINQEFQTGEVKYNEPIQIEGVNYSEGFQTGGVNYNETYETTGQDYTNFGQNNFTTTETTGDYNNLFGNTETTTTTTTTTQTFMGNTQNVDYGQINPIEQSIGFGEYQKTNY